MPVITHLGFELPVVHIQKGKYSRLGKPLRKKVKILFPADSSSPSLSSILIDLKSSIRTFISDYRSVHNTLLIPDNASIDVVFTLSQLANEFGLFLLVGARVSDSHDLMGYAICKNLPTDIPCDHRSLLHPVRVIFMIINRKHQSAGVQWQSIDNGASIELLNQIFCSAIFSALRCFKLPSLSNEIMSLITEFSSTPASIIMAARTQRALRDGPLSDVHQCILSFTSGFMTSPKSSLRVISRDAWLWLFFYTTHIEVISSAASEAIEQASVRLNTKMFRKNRTWKFQFYGRPNHIYFWGRMRPLIANELPPSYKRISSSLATSLPLMSDLHECLVARYEKSNDNLRYHQDTEGRKYYNMAESLILTFAGYPRELKFKPFFSLYPDRELVLTVKCTNNIAVQVSPLANELFLHSKAKCGCNDPSTTFAWRRGIPTEKARLLYPHLSV